jgi:hypothetical protein
MKDDDFGVDFTSGMLFIFCLVLVFVVGFFIGQDVGISKGEEKTALITVQSLNKIKQQLPKDTKIDNPFTSQELDTLSYKAQKILNLFSL